jgi:hypothetical protein
MGAFNLSLINSMSRLIVERLTPSHSLTRSLVLGYSPEAICRSIKYSLANADFGKEARTGFARTGFFLVFMITSIQRGCIATQYNRI